MAETETLKVELRPIEDVRPYSGNPRTITATAIDKVASSIREFGWRQPIVVDPAGVILVGHTRFLAAKKLKLTKVPVHVAVGLTADQAKAYRLADNRTHDEATWDIGALDAELKALQLTGFDLALTGFNFDQWCPAATASSDPDAPPPPLPAKPVTRAGDIWVLGDHRLLCGDSTDAAAVSKLLAGAVPNLMVTDPPYGVDYDPNWRGEVTGAKVRQSGKVLNDHRADWREAWVLFPGNAVYVWHAGVYASTVQQSLEASGFDIRGQIIWAKDRLVLSRGNYHWKHEPCWYAVRKGKTAAWRGSRKQGTVWEIQGLSKGKLFDLVTKVVATEGIEDTLWRIPATVDDGATGHGTQKPVECMRRPIRNNSKPGEGVYDPLPGFGLDAHRRRTRKAPLFWSRAQPRLLRCHREALGNLHRQEGAPGQMTEDGMPTSGMEYCDLVIRPRVGVRRPKPPRFKGSKAAKRAARLHRGR